VGEIVRSGADSMAGRGNTTQVEVAWNMEVQVSEAKRMKIKGI
jgi:hypothetical protein